MITQENSITSYAKALKDNDYKAMVTLFTRDAKVFSFLAGEQSPSKFFKSLFENSTRSKVEVKNVFYDIKNDHMAAAYLHLVAMWNKKYPIEFDAVDIFEFDLNNKIKVLKIVLDTYPIRVLKESLQR